MFGTGHLVRRLDYQTLFEKGARTTHPSERQTSRLIYVTSEPEEGWSGWPKYCFKYMTWYRPALVVSSF